MATYRICMISKSLGASIGATRAIHQSLMLTNVRRSFSIFSLDNSTNRINQSSNKWLPRVQHQVQHQQNRTFFSEETIRMEDFVKRRNITIQDYEGAVDKFFGRIEEILANRENTQGPLPLYTGDLTTTIYLCDGSDKQLNVIFELVKYFLRSTAEELPYPYFSVAKNSNLLMQLLHHLDRNDLIVKLCMDNDEFPNYMEAAPGKSFEVAVDSLFKHSKYQEIIDIYTAFMERTSSEKVPLRMKDVLVAVISSCYKLGTPEAYKTGINAICSGNPPPRFRLRTHTMVAALALKYDEPAIALNLLSTTVGSRFGSYITVLNIRLKALANLGRIEEAIVNLKQLSSLEGNIEFVTDTIEALKARVEEQNDASNKAKFESVISELSRAGKLSNDSLDDIFGRIIEKPFTKTIMENQRRVFSNRSSSTGDTNDDTYDSRTRGRPYYRSRQSDNYNRRSEREKDSL